VNVSLRVHELLEEVRVARFFMQTVRCEWEGLEEELEHYHAEGKNLYRVYVLHSLIDILFGCHIARGSSVISYVFSLGKVCFVAKITRDTKISQLKLDWHVSTISIKFCFPSHKSRSRGLYTLSQHSHSKGLKPYESRRSALRRESHVVFQ
jgi:hypothetical protein